jgi:DNA primase
VKAVNYLLPHVQRVPSRIVRDELAQEIAQKIGIDSSVLRQELKHAATNRAAQTVKATPDAQVTDAEKILIRALASSGEIDAYGDHISGREGAEEQFDPARQAQFALQTEQLHAGLATESLMEALLTRNGSDDVLQLPMSESDRAILAAILLKQEEPLSVEGIEGAVRALRRKQIRRKLEQVQIEIAAKRSHPERQALFREAERLKRALMEAGRLENSAVGGVSER